MTITRAQLKTLRTAMQAALDAAGIDDFELSVENMSFSATEVTVKVKGKLTGVATPSDNMFERKVAEYGLRLTGAKGEQLTGFKASRPKYPFSYTTVRGANYKCTIEQAIAKFSA